MTAAAVCFVITASVVPWQHCCSLYSDKCFSFFSDNCFSLFSGNCCSFFSDNCCSLFSDNCCSAFNDNCRNLFFDDCRSLFSDNCSSWFGDICILVRGNCCSLFSDNCCSLFTDDCFGFSAVTAVDSAITAARGPHVSISSHRAFRPQRRRLERQIWFCQPTQGLGSREGWGSEGMSNEVYARVRCMCGCSQDDMCVSVCVCVRVCVRDS